MRYGARVLCMLSLALGLYQPGWCQRSWGLLAGCEYSTISDLSSSRSGFGYHGGAFLQNNGPARFTPRVELRFSSRSFYGPFSPTQLDRLELPLLFNARIAGDLTLQLGAGPVFALRYQYGSESASSDFAPLVVDGYAGLVCRTGDRSEVGLRYARDLTSLRKSALFTASSAVELTVAYRMSRSASSADREARDTVKADNGRMLEPEEYWELVRQRKAVKTERRLALAEHRRERIAAHRAKQDSLHPWSMPVHAVILLGGGVLMPTDFTYPLPETASYTDPDNNVVHAMTTSGRSFGFGIVRWSSSKGLRPHVGLGLRFTDARYPSEPIEHGSSGSGSTERWERTYSGTAVLQCVSIGVPVLLGVRPSERSLVYCGTELRLNGSEITETGTMNYYRTSFPDLLHPDGITLVNERSAYNEAPSVSDIASFQVVWQLGYQRTFAKHVVAGLQVEFSSTRLSTSRDQKDKLLDQGGFPASAGLYVGWMLH